MEDDLEKHLRDNDLIRGSDFVIHHYEKLTENDSDCTILYSFDGNIIATEDWQKNTDGEWHMLSSS